MPIRPAEADPPLIVDAYAVLSFPIAFQRFQPVPGRNPEMIERTNLIQIEKLAARRALDGTEPGYQPVLEQRFSIR
jgi:hypothetical protein